MASHSAEVIPINIEEEMKGSYLDYAMSVIIGRALPDVRDGLKPVHRRILYAMFREGLLSNKKFSKCAGVVGEVLKKYHPHGDTAVYDTLVRMAQDWNLRYPLIDGQGNFGCFTGDTRVRLADGSSKSFEELVRDEAEGISHFTYTIGNNGAIAMVPIQAPRLTKINTPIVCVTLDNGEKIRCTPDHRFLLRDNTYREARDLKPNDALMPFYSRPYSGSDANLNEYEEVYNPSHHQWIFAHRLADAYNLKAGIYFRNAGRVRHHKDFHKWNNDPRNIIRMSWADHRRLHMKYLKKLWEDPQFRNKMTKVLAKLWKDPKFREKTIAAIGNENRRRWKDPAFQSKQQKAKEELWKNPEFRERILKAAMQKNVLLYGTEKQKEVITQAQREWLKAMWQDPNYIATQRDRMKEISKALWASPAHRKRMQDLSRRRMRTPEMKKMTSQWSKTQWQDVQYRKARSTQSVLQWKDPNYCEKFEGHFSSNGHVTTRARFFSICIEAMESPKGLNAESYERVRSSKKARGVVRFEQGFERYCNEDWEILQEACGIRKEQCVQTGRSAYLNHKVVVVEPAGRADVYDLTVDETHNFALDAGVFVHNSIDGDSAAAYRYTEARLRAIAEELLADIDKETVDFSPNFDGTTEEPTVLPSKIPNLLMNGSDGIAVGMATKIPPHNLGEIIDGCLAVIQNPNVTTKELNKLIPGPDFPTGGFIHGREGIRSAYDTGRGMVRMRARAVIESMAKGDRECIVVTEIPFQVNKAKLVERIAELVRDGKIEGISDLRDESDRDGMRIVIELKRGTVAAVVLNQLYTHTAMQSSFGVIMLSIVNGQPKVLNLREMLTYFVDHRKEVVIRRTAYELRKAEERAHILAGLKIAVENIDEVIALIKKSKEPAIAKVALIKAFQLSEIQAQAVLEMRLQRLTGLEREKIIAEYNEMQALMKKLKEILGSEKLVMSIISEELTETKKKFGDERRTVIQDKVEDLSVEDLIQEEEMVVTVSHHGYIKRNPISLYRAQRRGGKGKKGMTTREEDFVEELFVASTHNSVLIFSSSGKVYWLKVHQIPQVGRVARGQSITNLVNMSGGERIAAILPVRAFEEGQHIIMATKKGVIKKTDLMAYSNPRAGGIIACTIDEGDELITCHLPDGSQEIFLATKNGQAIRFPEADVRPMGRSARGVRGITLKKKDEVIGMEVLSSKATMLTVAERGYGKRSEINDYRVQSRGGSGIINLKVTDRTGLVIGVKQVTENDDIMLVTDGGKVIRSRCKEISVIGRATQGVRLINVDQNEKVVSVATLAEDDEDEASE